MLVRKISLAAGFVLSLAVATQAATLAAGPVAVPSSTSNGRLDCDLVNLGQRDVEVTMRAVVSFASSESTRVVRPAQVTLQTTSNPSAFTTLGYCVFEVKGGVKNVRATACVRDGTGVCVSTVPASK